MSDKKTGDVTILLQKQPIESAPRDGTTILVWFGQDGASQARYVPHETHPWEFIDKQGDNWIVNYAIDGLGGPSHWATMPR